MTGPDARRRAHYLAALGIDTYVSRRAPEVPAVADAAAATAAATAADTATTATTTTTATATADEPAGEWATLRAAVAGCMKCRLCETRTQTVFGVGDTRAQWLVVGEAPGAEEDRRGEPFVGRAGQLLNSMLRAVGLSRDAVFIANVLKCRPPGNREPRPDEVAACLPYLERQIALIEPALILAVGRIAAQNLLGSNAPLARLRGRVHQFGPAATPLVVTYHPAYLLRSPGEKRKAWEDLKLARSLVDGRRAD